VQTKGKPIWLAKIGQFYRSVLNLGFLFVNDMLIRNVAFYKKTAPNALCTGAVCFLEGGAAKRSLAERAFSRGSTHLLLQKPFREVDP
jgi:hypothetical protein